MSILQNTRNIIRVAGLGSALIAMSSAGVAAAAGLTVTTDTSNSTTGANSINENPTHVANTIRESFTNRANINNWAGFNVNTGLGDIRQNTTVDGVNGGSATVSATFNNNANSGATMAADDMGSTVNVSATGTNDTTGFHSSNTNTLDVHNNHTVTVNNTADIHNNVSANVDTSLGDIRQNTTVANVSGGNATVDLSVTNTANGGAAAMAGMGASTVSVSSTGGNNLTGANSENSNDVTVHNTDSTTVNNTADINNSASVNVNTGGGDISQNTSVNGVSTGDANITLSFTNTAN